MDALLTGFRNWMKSEDLSFSTKLACIAASLTCVCQVFNVGMTIAIGTDILGIALMLVMLAMLIAGIVYTVKRGNNIPLMVMLFVICFLMMPITYYASGGLYCGSSMWTLYSAVILGSILPTKRSIPVIALYLVIMSAVILYDGFNPGAIQHLSDTSFALDVVTALVMITIFLLLYIRLALWQFELKNEELARTNKRLAATLKETEEANKLLEKSYLRIEQEKKSLDALAEIYNSMYLINIKLKTYEPLGTAEEAVDDAEIKHVQQVMWDVMRNTVHEDHLENALAFTDFSTINERMQDKRSIALEAVNYQGEWWRFLFIRVGDLHTDVANVIYTSQYIDDEVREKEHLIRLSNYDELTAAFNRNAYITKTLEFAESGLPEDFWYMTVDINGLKTVNDNIGHDAGDELIRGAAECLMAAFGDKGEVYRIGGDEFVTFVYGSEADLKGILKKLDEVLEEWNARNTLDLFLSKGYVSPAEIPDSNLAKISKEADVRMYADKAAFYDAHPELNRRTM